MTVRNVNHCAHHERDPRSPVQQGINKSVFARIDFGLSRSFPFQ